MENYLPGGATQPTRQIVETMFQAVRNVAAFDAQRSDGISSPAEQAAALLAIETSSLETLAAGGSAVGLLRRYRRLQRKLEEVMS